ncbi:hypothetical protein BCV69DRAFT_309445 [Microstroma glucosiphilum]|uniref:Uncharacterized protein n=1 Tax=Pseudomicrostroma glucosiphilum TaxID=1684307 RepID=A0A316UF56_9BASI|nr:hypothetical protein BCV69DRAFT_309445 [Pseudomicrostroma glucosiphilum]PWN23554.1 hypothetical protein BCV69DRAFT_309445 [Pseudomicrostroma glucosiphilum]
MAVCSPPRGDVLPLDTSFATTSQMLPSPFLSPQSTSPLRDANSEVGSPALPFSSTVVGGRRRSSVVRPLTPSKASLPSTREVPEEAVESSDQPSMSFTVAPVQYRTRKVRAAELGQEGEARDTSDYETDEAGVASSRSSMVDFAPGRGPLLLNDTPRRRSSDVSSQNRMALEPSYVSSHYTDSDDEETIQKLSRKPDNTLRNKHSSLPGSQSQASFADTTLNAPVGHTAGSSSNQTSPPAPAAVQPTVKTPAVREAPPAEPLDSTALRQRVEELQRKITGGQRDASHRPNPVSGRDSAASTSATASSDVADLAQRVLALEVFLRKATAALPPLPASASLSPTKSQSSARSVRKTQDSSSSSRRPTVHRLRSFTHSDGTPRVSSDVYSSKQGSTSSSTITALSPHQPSSCASSSYAMSTRTLSQSSFASSMYTNGTRTTHTAATSVREGSGSDGDGEDEKYTSSSDRLRVPPGQHVQRQSRPGSTRLPSSDSSSVSSRRVIILNGNTEIMMDEQDRLYVRWAGDFVPLVDFFSSPAAPMTGRPSLPPLQATRSLPSGASAPVSSAASVRSTHSSGSTESGPASLRSVAPSNLTHNSAPGELGHGSGSGGLHSRSLAGFSMALPTKSTAERRQAILEQEEKIRQENARKGMTSTPKMRVGPGRGRMIVKAPKPPKAAK